MMHIIKRSILKATFRTTLMLSVLLSGIQLQGCAVAAVSGAATGIAMVNDRRTSGTIVDDQSIELKATHALTRHPDLWKQSHISIVCYNNVLLIIGQTPTEAFKQQAEDALKDIPKIRRIHNELIVKTPIPLSARSKDSWITTQVKAKMLGSKEVNSTRVKVITEDGVVYLLGLTNPQEQMAATEIARKVAGVQKVVQIFEST
jgi:osmotically-inducible protein OsmY